MHTKKLLLTIGIVNAALMGLILMLFSLHNAKITATVERMINQDQKLLLLFKDMQVHGLQTVTSMRNVMINPKDDKSRGNYKKAQEDLVAASEQAIKLASDKKVAESIKKVQALWEEDHQLKMQVLDLIAAGKLEEAKEVITKKQTSQFRSAREALREATAAQASVFTTQLKENQQTAKRNTLILTLIIAISLVGFSLFLIIINKSIQKNMAHALDCLETLERGDLRAENTVKDKSNFLREIYNTILSSLRKTVVKINAVSRDIVKDTVSLSERVNSIESSSQAQLSQVDHIVSASAEVSQTIVDVAKNASFASEAARQATDIAARGKGTVNKAVDAIGDIATSVKESSLTIEELGKSSEEIGEIVRVINDIADQTNLLALNAAIEAARAGEQGRGFAVVADEVRKLAERTGKATQEIADKITAIQQKAEASVEAMERSRKDAEGGVNLAGEAAKALQEIVVATERAMDMIQRIAAATEEQSSASEEIAHNMESISGLVNKTTGMINEARGILDGLNTHAKELDSSVGWFKV